MRSAFRRKLLVSTKLTGSKKPFPRLEQKPDDDNSNIRSRDVSPRILYIRTRSQNSNIYGTRNLI